MIYLFKCNQCEKMEEIDCAPNNIGELVVNCPICHPTVVKMGRVYTAPLVQWGCSGGTNAYGQIKKGD